MIALRQRVLVVDDHQTFAELLEFALEREESLEFAGYAASGAQAREQVALLQPQLVLMDVQLPDADGIELTAELVTANPELLVVVLTAHPDTELVTRAGTAGACGFLPKSGPLGDMLAVMRVARPGQLVLPPGLLRMLQASPASDATAAAAKAGLTGRELEVLQHLGTGLDPNSIAKQLGISLHTCRGHVKAILSKLHAHTQLEAVVLANRAGLIRVGH